MSENRKPLTYAEIGSRHRYWQPDCRSDSAVGPRHAPSRGRRGARRIRRTVRSSRGGLCGSDPGRGERRRRHQGEARRRERHLRHDRSRSRCNVRQRHCRPGRRTSVFPGLFRRRQARRGGRVRGPARRGPGVRRVRLRVDRRRDGGDARRVCLRRFRHRRLRCRCGRARNLVAPAGAESRRPRLRPIVVGGPFERIFAGPAHRGAIGPRLECSGALRSVALARGGVADADAPLRAPAASGAGRTRGICALAHITGGGYPDNLPRVLDDSLAVSLDLDAFEPPPVFSWLAAAGGLEEGEMLRTFNCGFGMAAFVSAELEAEAREALAGAGLSPVLIGELVSAAGRAFSLAENSSCDASARTIVLILGRGST